MSTDEPRVRQLRLVVDAPDFDAALAFYRDVLGLTEELAVAGPDGTRVVILDAGRTADQAAAATVPSLGGTPSSTSGS